MFCVLYLDRGGIAYSRRINTEEKVKVVAAAWAAELTQFLAALHTVAISYQDDMKNSMNSTKTIWRTG